jgi:predicted MPP superfamily phosphohydrolase
MKTAALSFALFALAQLSSAAPVYNQGQLPRPDQDESFLLLGDTQQTFFLERWLLRRESNGPESARLLTDAARERVAFLVHLGDLVTVGSSGSSWEAFDRLLAPVREAGIPVFPVLGNHDYWGRNSSALREAGERFPELRGDARWHSARKGSLGLVWVDTNRGAMSGERWRRQLAWYPRAVAELEADPLVRGILVFGHHPPFTNSKVTGDETHVQHAFLPALLEASKGLGMFSGHAHGYERFEHEGRAFVVSAGAGGPRVKLRSGASQRHADLNYGVATPDASGVAFEVRGFERGEGEARRLDTFRLDYRGGR